MVRLDILELVPRFTSASRAADFGDQVLVEP